MKPRPPQDVLSPREGGFLVAGIYALLSAVWVFVPMGLHPPSSGPSESLPWAHAVCGLLFVVATALVVAEAVRRHLADQAQVRSELQRNLERWRLLFHASRDAILTLEEGRVTEANPRALELFGVGPGTLRGRSFLELSPSRQSDGRSSEESLASMLKQTLSGRSQVFGWDFRSRDGTLFTTEVSISSVSDGERILQQAIIRELREKQALDRAVLETVRVLSQALDQADAVVFRRNFVENRYDFFGENIERLTGFSPDELTTAVWDSRVQSLHFLDELEALPHDERVRWFLSGRVPRWRSELLFRTRSGRMRWFLDISMLIKDAQGRGVAALGIIEDITPFKMLEDAIRQHQKMEAVGRLAGSVGEDFNHLVVVIQGYARAILDQLPAGDPSRPQLEGILKAAERSSEITRHLLLFSRRQPSHPHALQVARVVSEMEPLLLRLLGPGIEFSTRHEEGAFDVRADPSQLHQVLINLAANARDALASGGRFSIETSTLVLERPDPDRYPGALPGTYLALKASDNGVGMSPEIRAHLFEPFFTTKEVGKGTGLGLSTIYGIVRQAGGHIVVESEPGRGTTFLLLFPRAPAA